VVAVVLVPPTQRHQHQPAPPQGVGLEEWLCWDQGKLECVRWDEGSDGGCATLGHLLLFT
jgi:hypothetical protein